MFDNFHQKLEVKDRKNICLEMGILPTLLNRHCRYNIQNIHSCLTQDHAVMHVQYSSGVTRPILWRVLKTMVNISNGNNINKKVNHRK